MTQFSEGPTPPPPLIRGGGLPTMCFIHMMMMLTLVVKVKCSKFLEHEIVKLHGKIVIENCLFISKSINFDLHQFSIIGLPFPQTHKYKTSYSFKGFLKVNVSTKKYGREALINGARSSWNDIQKYFSSDKMLRDVPTFKVFIKEKFPRNSILLPSTYIASNVRNCNLCY